MPYGNGKGVICYYKNHKVDEWKSLKKMKWYQKGQLLMNVFAMRTLERQSKKAHALNIGPVNRRSIQLPCKLVELSQLKHRQLPCQVHIQDHNTIVVGKKYIKAIKTGFNYIKAAHCQLVKQKRYTCTSV